MFDLAPSEKRNPWVAILILCTITFVMSAYGAAYATWGLFTGWGTLNQHLDLLFKIDQIVFPGSTYDYTLKDKIRLYYQHYIIEAGLVIHLTAHIAAALIIAAITTFIVFIVLYTPGGADTYKHISGFQLFKYGRAVKYGQSLLREDITPHFLKPIAFIIPLFILTRMFKKNVGIKVHPKIPITKKRESEHMKITGMPGWGKSRLIIQIVAQYIARGELVFFFDAKPEFIAAFFRLCRDAILSPFDKRGIPWDIAADVINKPKAEQIASSMIKLPTTGQTEWAQGARGIFTGILLSCITEFDDQWSWNHIQAFKNLPIRKLHKLILANYPSAASYCDPESRSTTSYMSTLQANLNFIEYLAVGWKDAHKNKNSISMIDWINGKTKYQCVFFQNHASLNFIAGPLCNAVFTLTGNEVLTKENCEATKKVWVLDELFTMPKNDNLLDYLSKFRSKGGVIIIGVQDEAMIDKVYGEKDLKAINSIIGTSIIGKVSKDGGTADALSESLGKRNIERPQGRQQNGQINWTSDTIPIVPPHEIYGLPKSSLENGIEGFLEIGGNVMKLKWDLGLEVDAPKKGEKRTPNMIEKSWINAPISKKIQARIDKINNHNNALMAAQSKNVSTKSKTSTNNQAQKVTNVEVMKQQSDNEKQADADEKIKDSVNDVLIGGIDPTGIATSAVEVIGLYDELKGGNSDSSFIQSQSQSKAKKKGKAKGHENEM